MNRKHINKDDRNQIEILLKRGYLQKEIAEVLGFNKSSISKEIKRNSCRDGRYQASVAQHRADIKRRNSKFCSMKIQKNTELKERIVSALQDHQSPQAIAGRYRDISHVSIYKWLYSAWGQRYCRHLCSKQYKPRKQRSVGAKRHMIPDAISVHERPTQGVHLEGDLFVSSHNTVSVAVLVEPKSQYMWAVKIPNRKPSTMVSYINEILKDIQIDSITWDRGVENQYHKELNTDSYFCDPYSPWQKPHVENNIGLLRKWFVPKRTNLDLYEQKQLERHVDIVNNKWRKSRNFKSARELIEESGILKEKLLFGV